MTTLCVFTATDDPAVQLCQVCQRPQRAPAGSRIRRRCCGLLPNVVKPDPIRQHCVHLGAASGFRDCPSCRGTVKQKTYACLAGHGDVTLADCRLCGDYKPFGPTKISRVILPPSSFNGAIFEQDGRLRMCWRRVWHGGRLWVCDLDDDYRCANAVELDAVHPLSLAGREDPRVFRWLDRLHVSFCGVEIKGGGLVAHQLLARLNEAGTATEEVWCPEYPLRAHWEKNWGWFEHDGELHAVYSASPHVVLRGERTLEKAYETEWSPRWSGGFLRGGASPVRVGDEFWCFFHGAIDRQGVPVRVYSLGLYCFEAKPPFRPTRYTPEPLLWPDEATRPSSVRVSVVFPCGAVRRGDNWLVSYGSHDTWVDVAEFSHAGLERQLVKAWR